MKTILSAFFTVSFLLYSMAGIGRVVDDNQTGDQPEKTNLQIVSSPELLDLTSNWVANFENQHPQQKITISTLTEGTAFAEEKLYLTTLQPKFVLEETSWKMVVGHDVVVPIINSNNPLIPEIQRQGIHAEELALLVSENPNWSLVLDGVAHNSAKTYITASEQIQAKLANYTKMEQAAIQATTLASAEELIAAVQQDVNAIGFCRLIDILNPEDKTFASQISILPIDKNRNGRMDRFENIYQTPETLTRGVWLGKYPTELSGDIYAVATSNPSQQVTIDFLSWISAKGQAQLVASGYSSLSSREMTANIEALIQPTVQLPPGNSTPGLHLGWILAAALALVLVTVYRLVRSKQEDQPGIGSEDIEMTSAMNEDSIEAPAGLFYDKTHTWAFMERDGLVKIGVDDFLQHLTGALTQVKLKDTGDKIRKGEKILTIIREGKQLEIYSPVSGVIKAQNQSLLSTPTQLNTSPYSDGWVYKIEPLNWNREVRLLFRVDRYKEWLEDEFTRLKDFLAKAANTNTLVFEHLVLQDGGELTDNVLTDLGPDVWEDFQTKFIDTSK
ncbi:hypothetical protein [Sunxiuqinia sp. sy24]|uniref:hypothetical protein n=1 Tax=Sunxiuqinia sp. sy24 TaxID=3461495 RepID=UPI004045F75B